MLSSRRDECLFSASVFTLLFSLRHRDRFGFSWLAAKLVHEVGVGVRSVLETSGEKDLAVIGSSAAWISTVRWALTDRDPRVP